MELAEDVRIPRGWPRDRVGHHWLDLARAHTWAGHPAQALDSRIADDTETTQWGMA
ncbi:hypothetical protein [Streptomyces tubercidicus]|uniref:hypothetical protein n=1 Tax=Streptomyces tubercidicus TaxID=47759 RepID=UPI0036C1EA96